MTFTYTIKNLFVIDLSDTEKDFVSRAVYTLTALDDPFTASIERAVVFTSNPDEKGFIPYNKLTKNTLIKWIEKTEGAEVIDNLKDSLRGMIKSQRNPPKEPKNKALPFNN